MGDWGLRISQTGVDAKTAAGTQLQFSSKYSTLKILNEGTTSLTTDGSGNGTASVAHNLGYAPAHYVWLLGTANFPFLDSGTYGTAYAPITQSGGLWLANQGAISAYTNSGSLIITAGSAAATTTYNFKYYYLVDLGQAYSGTAGITLVDDYGLKVSKDTYDVKSSPEYNMVYSQKYKSLQYYDVLYGTASISLPLAYADPLQQTVETGSYIDILHGLGYPPFFLAWGFNFPLMGTLANQNVFAPQLSGRAVLAAHQAGSAVIDGWCDATRVRLTFYEKSTATANNVNGPQFAAKTVTFKYIIFTEDLST